MGVVCFVGTWLSEAGADFTKGSYHHAFPLAKNTYMIRLSYVEVKGIFSCSFMSLMVCTVNLKKRSLEPDGPPL